MNTRLLPIVLIVLFSLTVLTAEEQAPLELMLPQIGLSDLRFIENKGQWDERVQYKVRLAGGEIYFERDRITYFFYDTPDFHSHKTGDHTHHADQDSVLDGHVFRVYFEGMQAEAQTEPGLLYPEYHNYFLSNDPAKWAGGVSLYGLLTYRNVYPGIDMRIYGVGNSIKYDFILQPGADPENIRMRYDGVDKLYLKKQQLQVETAVRQLIEMPPIAYQTYGTEKKQVAAKFVLEENVLTYDLPQGYDTSRELVIDPTLIFSTHTGSRSDNWGFTATYDNAGNAYAGGVEWSGPSNGLYPITPGAIQTIFRGGQTDVTISKFNATGTALIYSTYLGGGTPSAGGADQPHSLVVNNSDELYIFGRTNSNDFPTTTGAYRTTRAGGFDLFVTRFNAAGTALLGSTFIGGTGDDGVNGTPDFGVYTALKYNYGDDSRGEIIVDAQGNVMVAACTQSTNFPVTPFAVQGVRRGSQDGCFFRMNANLTNLLYSTYLGGAAEDAAYTVQEDNAGNVFVAGGTSSSSNFPGISGYNGGQADGFVVRLNPAGSAITGGRYVGTSGYDQIFLLQLDRDQNVYVAGQSTGNMPIVNPASGPIYSNASGKQFVIKMDNALGTTMFSTRFGSNSSVPNISPTAFLVDRCDNVYISGWGGTVNANGSTAGMPITPDAYQSTTDGSDIYLAVFDRDMQSLTYGTFLGGNGGPSGEHVDGGTCRFDREGVVYHAVCAGCGGSPSFPSTPGVWSPNNQSLNNCNLAIFKMSFDLAGVEAQFATLDSLGQPFPLPAGCAPLELRFDNLSTGADPGSTTYAWDFGDGGTATTFEPTHVFQAPGVYEVRMIISDPTSCNIADTTFRQVTVFPPPVANAGPDIDACPGDTVALSAISPGATYAWSPSTGFLSSPNDRNPLVVVNATTTFTLEITDANGCTDVDQITVSTDNGVAVAASPDVSICRGGSTPIGATSGTAISYSWTPAGPLSDPNIASPTVQNLDTTTTFYVTALNALGCQGRDSVRVEVFEVFTLEDTTICEGSSIVLQTGGGVSFSWTPVTGLDNPNIASPTATPGATTTYTVTAISADGCVSTKSIRVELAPPPVADAGADVSVCLRFGTQLQASGGVSYAWAPVAGLSDPAVANPVASPGTTTTYTVTATDANGCTDTDQVTVTVNEPPVLTISDGDIICEGDQIQLLASGAVSYEWSPGNSLTNPNEANPIASPLQTTTYIVIGANELGCSSTGAITIEVLPQPQTQIQGENRLCTGGAIVLTASGGDSYLWSTGETTASIEVIPTQPVTLSVTSFIGSCEGTTASITVDQFFDFPNAEFVRTDSAAFAPGRLNFTNTSTGAVRYAWYFGPDFPVSSEENPIHTYPLAGTYEVVLIAYSETGCADTFRQTVFLDDITLFAPNAITPNGDGYNDEFRIGYVGLRQFNIQIFSRWGMIVFESSDPDFRWDGTYKGRSVPEGAYVYVVRGVGENGLRYDLSGTVTILR